MSYAGCCAATIRFKSTPTSTIPRSSPEAKAGLRAARRRRHPTRQPGIAAAPDNSSRGTLRRCSGLCACASPYYLFQGDPVFGTDHLRTPVAAGLQIIDQLRGFVPGMAIPHLVIDNPGGGNKIPIGPSYLWRRWESIS